MRRRTGEGVALCSLARRRHVAQRRPFGPVSCARRSRSRRWSLRSGSSGEGQRQWPPPPPTPPPSFPHPSAPRPPALRGRSHRSSLRGSRGRMGTMATLEPTTICGPTATSSGVQGGGREAGSGLWRTTKRSRPLSQRIQRRAGTSARSPRHPALRASPLRCVPASQPLPCILPCTLPCVFPRLLLPKGSTSRCKRVSPRSTGR
mmetsp:Transcript_12702/g.40519  ORF Transcript_12702/g.40519 Transcript_12702/m.40519 type:complete len:204 (+) Transcript_12702:994-1605(+)